MTIIKVVRFANGRFHYWSDDGLAWYRISKLDAVELIKEGKAKML